MFSQTYAGIIVGLLAALLPKIGIEVGSEALTTTISTILSIGGALWALRARHSKGDVSVLGVRKY